VVELPKLQASLLPWPATLLSLLCRQREVSIAREGGQRDGSCFHGRF